LSVISRRWIALFLQETLQQAVGCLRVAAGLHNFIKNVSVLVHSPPEPMLVSCNLDSDRVQMPGVMAARRVLPEAADIVRPKLQSPSADSPIGNQDAALEQHLLNQTQAQWEPELEPHSVNNDLGWEAVAFVANGLGHVEPSTRLTPILQLM
jgi:hypothetical protein